MAVCFWSKDDDGGEKYKPRLELTQANYYRNQEWDGNPMRISRVADLSEAELFEKDQNLQKIEESSKVMKSDLGGRRWLIDGTTVSWDSSSSATWR